MPSTHNQAGRSNASCQAAPRRNPVLAWCIGNLAGKADKRVDLFSTNAQPDEKIDAYSVFKRDKAPCGLRRQARDFRWMYYATVTV